MKRIPCALAVAAAASLPLSAAAQTPPARTLQTADYVEHRVGGDDIVTFTGDELAGVERGVFGTVVRRLPGTVRVGLLRPRMNFVSELLKSVENL